MILNMGDIGRSYFLLFLNFLFFKPLKNARQLKSFLFLRFSRIYPAYWPVLIILFSVDYLKMAQKFGLMAIL